LTLNCFCGSLVLLVFCKWLFCWTSLPIPSLYYVQKREWKTSTAANKMHSLQPMLPQKMRTCTVPPDHSRSKIWSRALAIFQIIGKALLRISCAMCTFSSVVDFRRCCHLAMQVRRCLSLGDAFDKRRAVWAGFPLLGNLSLDWEFYQCLGKNLGYWVIWGFFREIAHLVIKQGKFMVTHFLIVWNGDCDIYLIFSSSIQSTKQNKTYLSNFCGWPSEGKADCSSWVYCICSVANVGKTQQDSSGS